MEGCPLFMCCFIFLIQCLARSKDGSSGLAIDWCCPVLPLSASQPLSLPSSVQLANCEYLLSKSPPQTSLPQAQSLQ